MELAEQQQSALSNQQSAKKHNLTAKYAKYAKYAKERK